ncbi:MAG: hypothetical protein AB1813_02660 [Verrucomicrobiota bacterium]
MTISFEKSTAGAGSAGVILLVCWFQNFFQDVSSRKMAFVMDRCALKAPLARVRIGTAESVKPGSAATQLTQAVMMSTNAAIAFMTGVSMERGGFAMEPLWDGQPFARHITGAKSQADEAASDFSPHHARHELGLRSSSVSGYFG